MRFKEILITLISPFLIALSPVLFLYSLHLSEVRFSYLALPSLVALSFACALLSGILSFTKDLKISAVMSSFILSLFFLFKPVTTVINLNGFFYMTLSILVSLFLYYFMLKKIGIDIFGNFIFYFSIVLILMPIINILSFHALNYSLAGEEPAAGSFGSNGGGLQTKADIFHIMVDSYAASEALKNIYGYDNSDFINFLKEKNFYVAEQSFSNYSFTLPSYISIFNFGYLHDFNNNIGYSNYLSQNLLWKNKVFKILKNFGYDITVFKSGDSLTDFPEWSVDEIIAPDGNIFYDENFCNALIDATPLEGLYSSFKIDKYAAKRSKILFNLSAYKQINEKNNPSYVLILIDSPHAPFLFDEEGKPLNEEIFSGSAQSYVSSYKKQIQFLNNKLKELINKLITKSKRPFVIFLQSDHGPDSYSTAIIRKKNPGASMAQKIIPDEKRYFQEKFSIINAFYFHDMDYEKLYPSISPVNTFRAFLSKYLKIKIDLLKDESYYMYSPPDFKDISNILKSSAGSDAR